MCTTPPNTRVKGVSGLVAFDDGALVFFLGLTVVLDTIIRSSVRLYMV